MKLVACALALAACGGGSSTQDAASDAASGAFPGCAPMTGEPAPVCTPTHFCWISPAGRAIHSVSGGGCDYWLAGDSIYRMNGDVITRVEGIGGANAVQVFPTEAWTVGGSTMRFDGMQWTTVDTSAAYRIWGTDPDEVWVRRLLDVARWDGHEMRAMRVLPSNSSLALWGTSASDVRVADDTQVAHWNGDAWSLESVGSGPVTALWGDAPDDWYAIAGADIWHFDGASWTPVYAAARKLHAIWGSAADDVWVAGENLVLHGSGTTWSTSATPQATILAIHGSGRDDVVFAGADYIARWNGSRIDQLAGTITLAPGETTWTGMYGASASDVWAVANLGTLAHWDGSTWSTSRVGDALTATAIGGAPGELWVAGAQAGTMHVWRRAGDTWSATDLGAPGTLRAIHVASAADAWAVGERGVIYHFDGGTWQQTASPSPQELTGVWGNASDAWAVGGFAVLHWNGSAWSRVNVTGGGPYVSVWGRAANEVYIGGGAGALIRYDGQHFILRSVANDAITAVGGTPSTLWGTSTNSVFLDRGTGPYLLGTPTAIWYGAYFPSRTDGWIAGRGGALMRYQP